MEEKLTCGLLRGEAENEKNARNIAKSYRDCPYIKLFATKGKQIFATFFLPKKQTWWIKSIENNPKSTFGLVKAEVTITKNVEYPRRLKMRLPDKPKKTSPCRSNCETCNAYEKCLGCPSTIFYKPRMQ